MATLKEIYDFVGSADSSVLRNKIVAALVVRGVVNWNASGIATLAVA